jgi:hypothetical protein
MRNLDSSAVDAGKLLFSPVAFGDLSRLDLVGWFEAELVESFTEFLSLSLSLVSCFFLL